MRGFQVALARRGGRATGSASSSALAAQQRGPLVPRPPAYPRRRRRGDEAAGPGGAYDGASNQTLIYSAEPDADEPTPFFVEADVAAGAAVWLATWGDAGMTVQVIGVWLTEARMEAAMQNIVDHSKATQVGRYDLDAHPIGAPWRDADTGIWTFQADVQ